MEERLSDAELDALCEHWDCLSVRQLDDGTLAGIARLMTTVAIMLDLTRHGYERRFCYRDFDTCVQQFTALRSSDDEPIGWVARRPEQPCDHRAKGSPDYLGGDPALPTSWRNGAMP